MGKNKPKPESSQPGEKMVWGYTGKLANANCVVATQCKLHVDIISCSKRNVSLENILYSKQHLQCNYSWCTTLETLNLQGQSQLCECKHLVRSCSYCIGCRTASKNGFSRKHCDPDQNTTAGRCGPKFCMVHSSCCTLMTPPPATTTPTNCKP